MEEVVTTSTSSGTPSAMEKSPLDFSNEDPSLMITNRGETENLVPAETSQEDPPAENTTTAGVVPEVNLEKEETAIGPLVNKRRRKRDKSEMEANAPPKVLRTDHASVRIPSYHGIRRRHSFPYARATKSSKGATIAGDPDSEKSSSFSSFVGSPGGIYQPGWGITNNCRLDTPGVCQDAVDHMVPPGYFSELRHLPNEEFLNQYNVNLARQVTMGSQLRLRFEQEVRLLKKAKEKVAKRDQRIQAREEEIKKLDTKVQGLCNQTRNLETLLEAEVDMKKAAKANSAELTKELESLRAKFSDLQVNNNQLTQQVSTLQAQVTGEEQIKAAFEEFKKREDDKVEKHCAEMDARLDALSIDFDEELHPHMLTAIASRRWVIGHGLRLAVMKCAESTELRQVFVNVVSAGIAKGMSEGLKHRVEHGKDQLDLEAIEAYDPEADAKYVAALHALKDLKYPLID
ncbi:hypothetical protein Tco_0359886 [Tanacetum coccineum]